MTVNLWIEVVRDLLSVCKQLLTELQYVKEENQRLKQQEQGYDTVY